MSVRKYFKRLGRKTLGSETGLKIGRATTIGVSAAAGFFGGPIASTAVSAIGGVAGGYARSVQARDQGQPDRARALARGERSRQFLYGSAAGAIGSIGSGVASASVGGSFAGGAAAGQGGQALLGGTSLLSAAPASSAATSGLIGNAAAAGTTAFKAAAAASAPEALVAANVGGTWAMVPASAAQQLGAPVALGSGFSTVAGVAPSAVSAAGFGTGLLATAASAAAQVLGRTPTTGTIPGGGSQGGGSGGGGGGDGSASHANSPTRGGANGEGLSGGAIAALALGAFLLLS